MISSPAGSLTRPTSLMVREALFSIIGDGIRGAVFADLFAGTGAIGIEALSRGAGAALFADKSRNCVKLINANLAALGIAEAGTEIGALALALCVDMSRTSAPRLLRDGLERLGGCSGGADFIYVDPPYSYDGISGLPGLLFGCPSICKNSTTLIIEHGAKVAMPDIAEGGGAVAQRYSKRKYGDSVLSFYKKTSVAYSKAVSAPSGASGDVHGCR